MLIVKIAAESNGARASQMSSAEITPPAGYITILPHLEAITLPLLPWVILTIEDGIVTAVEDDVDARATFESTAAPPTPPTEQERIDALESAVLELIIGGTV